MEIIKRLNTWMKGVTKGSLIGAVAILTLLSVAVLTSNESQAQNCKRYQDRADYYTSLRRKGGSSRQMTTWLRERNKYKDLYHECRRKGGSDGAIDRVSGPRTNRDYSDHKNTYQINTDNKAVRKLYETCNYWIREHNSNPGRDTLTFRNTACKAAREGEREARDARAKDIEHVRSVEDYVKQNTTVDNEVSECMQGKIEPYWKE